MNLSASSGICSPRSAEQLVVGLLDAGDRRDRQAGSQIRQCHLPNRGYIVDNHDNWATVVLGRVPGVEQLRLAVTFRPVEQPAVNPLDEGAGEQRPSRTRRPGQDRRLDRPQAPSAKMLERLTIGFAEDEAAIVLDLGPIERERDLVRRRFHGDGLCCGAGAGVGALGAELSLTVVPSTLAGNPRATSWSRSAAGPRP